MIYLGILIVLNVVGFITEISREFPASFYVPNIVATCMALLMLYGVYSCNTCLITTGLVLCYIGVILLAIAVIAIIIELIFIGKNDLFLTI